MVLVGATDACTGTSCTTTAGAGTDVGAVPQAEGVVVAIGGVVDRA